MREFNVVPLSEFVAQPDTPRWLLKPFLPGAGLFVLSGDPGAGKTFVELDMVWRVAAKGLKVVLIVGDTENREAYRARFRALAHHAGVALTAVGIRHAPYDGDNLPEVGTPDLILIDGVPDLKGNDHILHHLRAIAPTLVVVRDAPEMLNATADVHFKVFRRKDDHLLKTVKFRDSGARPMQGFHLAPVADSAVVAWGAVL